MSNTRRLDAVMDALEQLGADDLLAICQQLIRHQLDTNPNALKDIIRIVQEVRGR